MKSSLRWLKSIPCSAMPILLASCASTYIPTDSAVGNMSTELARKVLSTGLKEGCTWGYKASRLASELMSSCERITNVRVTSRRLLVTDRRGKKSSFIFSELPQISETNNFLQLAGQTIIWGKNIDSVLIDALYVLQQDAIKQKKEEDVSFAASLADYRKKAASNAALPEEANKYKVQAEGAVRDKEFEDAADFYAEALKIAPWWPVGRFNRALVLGEAGDYELAKREMNYYLQLVPNAPNARAAQDKIYEWERLESK